MSNIGMIGRIGSFLQEVQAEVKKVTWPTGKDTATNTVIVVVFAVVIALILGFFDFILQNIFDRFLI